MFLAPQRSCEPRLLVFSKFLLGLTALLLGFSVGLSPMHAWAQNKTKKTEKKTDDDKEIPDQEDIDLATEDGLEMKVAYFAGTKGQESIPVILLHGFNAKEGKHSGKDLTGDQGLAKFLQAKLGCAVVVPDLRGHGESMKIKVGKRIEDLKGKKLSAAQASAMVTQDLRAVKDFLWKKNNEKALNIDKLVVIGVEEGAALALSYTAYDAVGYEQRQPKYGPLKLGRFVKAAVLISPPPTNIMGLKTPQVMKMPEVSRDLPVMIVVGNKNREYFAEAERLRSLFVKSRPPADDDKPESRTVWFFNKIDTPLQGIKLLAEPSLNVPEMIETFLNVRLVKNSDIKDECAWKERKLPHE